jgi:hypothetical protein
MGSGLSKRYVIQIENKKLTAKELRALKTYADVLQVAGYNVDGSATIRKMDKYSTYMNANEPFQFGGTLIYEGKAIYICKLY